MRKITSQKEKERKQKRNNLIITILLSLVLLFSIGGYSFIGGDDSDEQVNNIKYNGFDFYKQSDYWITSTNNYNLIIKNNPKNISEIQIPNSIKRIENYHNKPVYVYSNNSFALREIYNNLNPENNKIVQRIQETCIQNRNCEKNLPIKDCSDNVIIIEISDKTKISQEQNCVFIQGNKEEIIKITDKFLLYLLRID